MLCLVTDRFQKTMACERGRKRHFRISGEKKGRGAWTKGGGVIRGTEKRKKSHDASLHKSFIHPKRG